MASGDTAGWIVPCGCDSNQSGGLLRRGGFLGKLREERHVIYVDVGGAASGDSEYDRLKFEATLKGEAAMAIAAHNLGASELRLGAEYLREVTARLRAPLITCNAYDSKGALLGAPWLIVEAADRRIALVGVVSARYAAEGVRIDSPLEALLSTIEEVSGRYDSLAVLAYLPEDELNDLAANLPEADVVIGGPTGQSISPRLRGPTLLASATNKGKFIAVLAAPSKDTAHWAGEIVELDQTHQDHAQQRANLEAFYTTLAERDLTPRQTGFTKQIPFNTQADFGVAGSESCQACHTEDCQKWRGSAHARAWSSLESTGAHVDPYCQQCHTTGYGLPGGFQSISRTADRVDVGCESCHGPSLAHAKAPQTLTSYAEQSRGQCTACHDRENSPRFEYEEYWRQVNHGVKVLLSVGDGES